MSDYLTFLERKTQLDGDHGFDPIVMPDALFDFQQSLVTWAVRKGRAAILADCGLGKTLMELAWAQNVSIHTGKPVLILTPLAVAGQFEQEAHRFGFDATHSRRGEIEAPIVIANYERLHLFDADRFGGIVCDESSILKSFDGMRRRDITEVMRTKPYRLLSTATAAPNDFIELGTSSEALGYLGYLDMLSRYFVNDSNNNLHQRRPGRFRTEGNWRFKGHAEQPFWRWVASWARAMRRPSDLGFSDERFVLDPLIVNEHVVEARSAAPGMLFALPANGLREEREERRRTLDERCEMVAELVNDTGQPAVVWCHLNDEGDLLERLIPDGKQVSGKDTDERKEATFDSFSRGELRVLITKPKIGAWGLNWQHCNHLTYFPSHSYEQYYQAVRRCWRFGQTRPVTVDIVATEGEVNVQQSLQRKSEQADQMFTELVAHMTDAMGVRRLAEFDTPMEVPQWLLSA
ncbi:MAG TPA: DEAD/DEAH box helicase [Steroidobacteraceae bacterium]|nr:DEAD/DEAH box helicase [Steroidobacteraceae bacterium]